MNTTRAYRHASRIGTFLIHQRPTGDWQITHDSENLGSGYSNAQQALDDLAGGHCDWPGTTDPSTLGLPDDISDWVPVRRA